VPTLIERSNLFFEVRSCPEQADKEEALRTALGKAGPGALLYCATLRAGMEVAGRLAARGLAAELLHARRRAADREAAQRRFVSGETPVLVAMSGAGTALEKPDLRLVVHWNLPDSVENYAQEAAQAGLDGRPATALLLYRPEDRRLQSFFTGGRTPPREELRATWNALERAGTHPIITKRLAADAGLTDRRAQVAVSLLRALGVAEKRGAGYRRARGVASTEDLETLLASYERRAERDRERLGSIVRYAQTALCRRQALRTYFGEDAGTPCGHCDNCRDRPQVATEVMRAESSARPGMG
jgi:ATP-dependent DNA helicase RecQ